MNGYVRDAASVKALTDQPRCEGSWQESCQSQGSWWDGGAAGSYRGHWRNVIPVGMVGTCSWMSAAGALTAAVA